MARAAELRELFRRARRRARSPEDYLAFQQQQGAMVCRALAARGVHPPGHALDLGCGLGGYTLALREAGYRTVSLDLDPTVLRGTPWACSSVAANAAALPFGDAAFHLVLCASLIEHVPSPENMLREIHRALVPGGACYLSFPPFCSPMGGHQFAPFHLLGERMARAAFARRRRRTDPGWRARYLNVPAGFADAYGAYGLHRMTIARARALALAAGFAVVDQSVRYLPLNTTRWGVLGELLTWHAQFLLRKPP